MERVDCVVIGAGVVGLATARALAQRGREVLVIEAAPAFGTGVSSRNSEVVHAGLYYPQASLKARWCVAGREALYAYCAERRIAHRRCGKLIVATQAQQLPRLHELLDAGRRNGVAGLQWLSRAEALALEPALECEAAVWSPETGIVDSHGYMQALLADAEQAGAVCAYNSPVHGLAAVESGFRVETGGYTAYALHARSVVNAAGLNAVRLAQGMRGMRTDWLPAPHFAKGSYFTLAGKAPFARLVYPLPEPGGLGVHLTLDLGGQARFGPDVQWLETPSGTDADAFDYRVDPARGAGFDAAIRTYWPGLPADALQPAYAGVRPKLHGPDSTWADFLPAGPAVHGLTGLVHLLGIESPGLTASLAIAQSVAQTLDARR